MLSPYLVLLLLNHATGDSYHGARNEHNVGAQMNSQHVDINGAEQFVEDNIAVELQRSLRFEPPILDFGIWSVGTARTHAVTLFNQNFNRSVYLNSVSGRTPSIYSSFFKTKIIPPYSNTTFNVVFLPRELGAVHTDLLIHTSFGQLRLDVRGEGQECPYRLKSIIGIKAPLNATITPEIRMYNPHERPLQILEIYSSGGQFQLELPSGGQEGPQSLWEIPPFSMKPVIRIRFHGRSSGNYTAYIRIKISEPSKDTLSQMERVLVIPVGFEILAQYGMFAEDPLLDFGRVTTKSTNPGPLHLKLKLKNSNDLHKHELVAPYQKENGEFRGLFFDPKDALITLNTELFVTTTMLDRILTLRSVSTQNTSYICEFTVIVRAEIFKGTLHFTNATTFVTQNEVYLSGEQREIVVRNDFETPISLMHMNLEEEDSNVINATLSKAITESKVVLAPGKSIGIMKLQVLNETATFNARLRIYTNITQFDVPIIVCTGRLHVSTQDADLLPANRVYNVKLNLGVIPLAEMSHNGFIILENRNPLSVKLTTWDFQSPRGIYFHTTFLGCLRAGDKKVVKIDSEQFKFCSHLEMNDIAIFQIAIKSYKTDLNSGILKIWTAYEEITTTVSFLTWVGKLEVDQEHLYFRNCFPGKLCFSDLSIRSSFQHCIHVISVNFTDPSLRFVYTNMGNSLEIAPNAVTRVGRIYFQPALLCQDRCYIPQNGTITSSVVFPSIGDTKVRQNNNLLFDEVELRRRTELFRQLKWYFQTISFTINSQEIRQIPLHLIVDFEWPKLVTGKQILAPIEVGKMQQMEVVIKNPADTAILVDYFLADPKYAKETTVSLPLEVIDISANCYLTNKSVFKLPESPPKKLILIPAQGSILVSVRFESNEASDYCTLLYIRNNLTLYEAVWLSARTVQSRFRLGNRKPGSTTPLLFEITEKHLYSTCSIRRNTLTAGDQRYPLITTRRLFTARNTGEIPIWIDSFLIGNQPCEGYGFKVVDCVGFELKPNESKNVEIAFSPDFTSTRVTLPLILRTNLSYIINYVLLAQLPPMAFDQCVDSLLRPPWEQYIRNAAIIILTTTFIFVLIAAHIDFGNILLMEASLHVSREKGPVHPTFNLRNVAQIKSPCISDDISSITNLHQNIGANFPLKGSSVICNSSNNANILKHRTIKKLSSMNTHEMFESPKDGCLADISWALELVSTTNKKVDAEKVVLPSSIVTTPPSSSFRVSSTESSSKSIFPAAKCPQLEQKDSINNLTNNGSGGGVSKKQQQRAAKRLKNNLQQPRREDRTNGLPQKPKQKYPKSAEKEAEHEQTKTSTKSSTGLASARAAAGLYDVQGTQRLQMEMEPANKNSQLGRKHGKTPGRERKKEQVISIVANYDTSMSTTSSSTSSSICDRLPKSKSGRKQRRKAINSLHHNVLPLCDEAMSKISAIITSPWETCNQVSFSKVVQSQNSSSSLPDYSSNAADLVLNITCALQENNNLQHSLLNIDGLSTISLKAGESDLDSTSLNAINTALNTTADTDKITWNQLGPIGTKKSPSSTPVWEPVAATTITTHHVPKPIIPNNASFFSNLLPAYVYDDGSQFMNVPTAAAAAAGLYELKKVQEELRHQWQKNECILNLRQQIHAQQQLLHTGGVSSVADSTTTTTVSSNWALNLPTWSPMGYEHNVTQQAPPSANVAPTHLTAHLGPWQNGVIRPPPGLEANFQILSNHHGTSHRQQQTPQPHGEILMAESLSTAVATTTSSVDEIVDVQAFDPFSSLSSIWSENWNKNHNDDSNNHRNNIN